MHCLKNYVEFEENYVEFEFESVFTTFPTLLYVEQCEGNKNPYEIQNVSVFTIK